MHMTCIWESHLSEYLNGNIHFCFVCHVLMFNSSMDVEHCRYMILSSFQWGCVDVKPICYHYRKVSCCESKVYCSGWLVLCNKVDLLSEANLIKLSPFLSKYLHKMGCKVYSLVYLPFKYTNTASPSRHHHLFCKSLLHFILHPYISVNKLLQSVYSYDVNILIKYCLGNYWRNSPLIIYLPSFRRLLNISRA